jgi:glucose-1-phosphate adenylyltransferase
MKNKLRLDAIIMGGGRGERLNPLTKYRAKPAVQIGAKYRLIDVPISNCINSGIKNIRLLTQFNTLSLHRHIYRSYQFDLFSGGNVEILAAQQTYDRTDWFQGTADAVRSYWSRLESIPATHYVILAGDHLYKMDYSKFFKSHLENNAQVSIAVKPKPLDAARELGVLKTDQSGRITEFAEKPQTDEEINNISQIIDGEECVLASMGIYIFNKEVLRDALKMDGNDFGKNIIPASINKFHTFSYHFDGYWEDIGTIRTFFEANMALTDRHPPFSFYDVNSPVYTHSRFLPGAIVENARIEKSFLAEGCHISNATIQNSLVGIRSIIGENVKMDHTYLMGADFYEDMSSESDGNIPVGIGNNSILKNVIIDKNARIGKNVQLVNSKNITEEFHDNYVIRDGIIVIPKGAVIPDGTII